MQTSALVLALFTSTTAAKWANYGCAYLTAQLMTGHSGITEYVDGIIPTKPTTEAACKTACDTAIALVDTTANKGKGHFCCEFVSKAIVTAADVAASADDNITTEVAAASTNCYLLQVVTKKMTTLDKDDEKVYISALYPRSQWNKETYTAWQWKSGAEVKPTVCAVCPADGASRYAATLLASAAALAAMY